MKGVLIILSVFVIIEGGYIHNQDDDGGVHSMVDQEDNAEEVEIASEAFIYLYPVLCTMGSLFSGNIWPHYGVYHPLNTFNYINQILDWTAMANSDPSEDYMYAVGMLDLETHPIALKIPAIPDKRYYSVTVSDCYMINIKTISPRTRDGSWAADQYVIVGPGFRGSLPSHFDDDHIVRSLCRFTAVVGRTAVYGPDDTPNVVAIQNSYTLQSLDGNEPQKTNVPVFPFVDKEVIHEPVPEPQVFFSYANFITNYIEFEDHEYDLIKKFSNIEVGPSMEFIGQEMSQQMYRNIQDGVADGSKKIDDARASQITVNGWTKTYVPKNVHDDDYLGRAVFAKSGVYFNDPEEALYFFGWEDVNGDPFDSTKYDYTLTLLPGQFPPVVEAYAGFWSISAYEGSGPGLGNLIHNSADRYLISSTATPGIVYDANGALTLYIQKTRPDTDAKAANWLPTPDPEFGGYETGEFHLILRVYISENMDYFPPGVTKAKTATF